MIYKCIHISESVFYCNPSPTLSFSICICHLISNLISKICTHINLHTNFCTTNFNLDFLKTLVTKRWTHEPCKLLSLLYKQNYTIYRKMRESTKAAQNLKVRYKVNTGVAIRTTTSGKSVVMKTDDYKILKSQTIQCAPKKPKNTTKTQILNKT